MSSPYSDERSPVVRDTTAAVRTLELRDASMLEQLRDASVRDLRAFITERGFSYAGLAGEARAGSSC